MTRGTAAPGSVPAARAGRPSPGRRALVGALLAAALGLGAVPAPPARAEDPPREGSPACGIPAFVDEDDAGMRAAYDDGVRRGLEEANLPRVCLRRPERDDPEAWARATAAVGLEGPPLVFAIGRRASARIAASPPRRGGAPIPCVYVDAAPVVDGRPSPEDPRPPTPCAVVRAHVSADAWGRLLRELLPGRPRPTVLVPWERETKEAAAWREAFGAEAHATLRTRGEGGASVDAILDLSPGLGEAPEAWDAVLGEARARRIPLLSAERARFRAGAAVVLLPDHALLGRVAAEAARRLLAGEGAGEPLRLVVRTTRRWVDLEAADAEGLRPPLTFLAGSDLLRRAPAGAAGDAR